MKTTNEIYLEKMGSYIYFGKIVLKIFMLFLVALLFLSCSNDDNEQCTYTCNAWVKPDGQIRTIIPLELDCETNQPINLPQGYEFLGCDNDNTP